MGKWNKFLNNLKYCALFNNVGVSLGVYYNNDKAIIK